MLSGKMTSACLCVHAHVQALAMKRGDEETSKCKKQKSIISSSSHHWYFGDAKHKELKKLRNLNFVLRVIGSH